ncbi:MAG: hypothetical protein ABL925_21435 [Methylococcales bacterium]
MNTLKNNAIALALATSVGSLLVSGMAYAADGKDYPGAHCMPDSSDPAFVVTPAGAIMNPSGNSSLTVICPGINDVGTPVTGVVTLVDANPDAPIRCTLESRARGGTVIGQSIRQTPIGEGVRVLNFNTVVPNQVNSYFYYRCTLPPASQNPLRFSQILSYEFDEQ